MYGRFDIGLKLLSSSGSAVGFFKMGVIIADFSAEGIVDDVRDKLIILVMMGTNSSRHSLMRKAGAISREHDFDFDDWISSRTSSSVAGSKQDR